MNPLGVSVIFVICSILLSFLKHMLFPSSQSEGSITKFNKVFQLTDNKIQPQSKYYKSLYEAYHKSEVLDAQKYTNLLSNRSMFNQSVLRNSLLNQEMSLMCGSEYLVLVLSGVSASRKNDGHTRFINVFQVYRLPLMTKLEEIKIYGKVVLPHDCKQSHSPDEYQLGIITKIGPMLLLIDQERAVIRRLSRSSELSYYVDIDKFDYDGESVAYWSKQRPWIIRIENNHIIKSNIYAQLPSHEHEQEHLVSAHSAPVQINLLNIQMDETESEDHLQHLTLRHIYLTANTTSNSLHLSAIYSYHNLGAKQKYIILSSFEIDHHTMALLDRAALHVSFNPMQPVQTQCMRYINDNTHVHDISCVIFMDKQEVVKFVNLWDIYRYNRTKHDNHSTHTHNNKINEQTYFEHGYADWIDDHLEDVYDSSDDDLLYMQSMTPLASNSYFQQQADHTSSNRMSFIFKAPKLDNMRIIKPSLPDPIVYYSDQDQHFMFTFNFPTQNLQQEQQSISLSTLFFSFSPPISDKEEEKALRDIKLIEKQRLIVVVWGGGIQVYEYQNMRFSNQNGQGIAMSAILPFVELFATVFCLSRIVWNPQ